MKIYNPRKIGFIIAFLFCAWLRGQDVRSRHLLEPADTFNHSRFWLAAGTGTALYAGASAGLWHAWYKSYELSGFHTFNDANEWEYMDKIGHAFTSYIESYLIFQGARGTGMSRKKAIWTGAGGAMLLQSTIEVMDGFSAKWGFSWADMAFNAAGAGLFVGQELLWEEQRIRFKVSNTRPEYSDAPVFSIDGGAVSSLKTRAFDLFGTSFAEAFLKDYNGQTLWLSVNPSAFLLHRNPGSRFPKWLSVSVGYGAENMYGGFSNSWTDDKGNRFLLEDSVYPRYRQFFLSLDIDLTRIPTQSRLLKLLFGAVSWIKIPAPTLEVNTRGGVVFRPLYW